MAKKTPAKKKPNMQDATLLNVRALKKTVAHHRTELARHRTDLDVYREWFIDWERRLKALEAKP